MSFYTEFDHLTLPQLIAHFHAAPPSAEEDGYTYYSELTLLIRQQGAAGVDFLWKEAQKAESTRLRAILLALTQPPSTQPAIGGWLMSLLQESQGLLLAEVIDSLNRQGQKNAVEQLLPLLKDPSPYVRGSVLRFMSRLHPDSAVPLLIEALLDSHFIVRENAADELGELQAVEARADLIVLLQDPHPHVREAVQTAIEMIDSLEEEQVAETFSSEISLGIQAHSRAEEEAMVQDVEVSMKLSKPAIDLLLKAIEHYLNEQDKTHPTSWLSEHEKSNQLNGRYYLEAIKSNLKAVNANVMNKAVLNQL